MRINLYPEYPVSWVIILVATEILTGIKSCSHFSIIFNSVIFADSAVKARDCCTKWVKKVFGL